jgi:hypothetical protein
MRKKTFSWLVSLAQRSSHNIDINIKTYWIEVKTIMKSIISILLSLLAVSNAVELNLDNYDELTSGKTVFIKFLAPWWGHCKVRSALRWCTILLFLVCLLGCFCFKFSSLLEYAEAVFASSFRVLVSLFYTFIVLLWACKSSSSRWLVLNGSMTDHPARIFQIYFDQPPSNRDNILL